MLPHWGVTSSMEWQISQAEHRGLWACVAASPQGPLAGSAQGVCVVPWSGACVAAARASEACAW